LSPQCKVIIFNIEDVGRDFYKALDNLYNNPNGCFSSSYLNIKSTSSLYIFGESYAGKYVPAIAAEIMRNLDNGGFLKGLKGIGIGDGFTSPYDTLA
jgi:vitellogenic carboxypeptidase-like protein